MLAKKKRVSSTFDILQKQEYLYRGPNHAANLNDMRLKDKYCDVTIKVSGKEIRAHKVILAANLKYFETMFSSDSFQESQGGVITMESVEKTDLEMFVSYAYTGEILLTEENAMNLLELAHYLSEGGIEEACVEFLRKHLKSNEACRAYKFADAINCPLLKNVAKTKLVTNFEEVSKSADYLNFDGESLMDILSDGKVQSIQLFKGILRWIKHSAKERKTFIEDLLSSIDTSKLKADDLTGCLFQNFAHHDDEYGIIKDVVLYYEARKMEPEKQGQVFMVMNSNAYQCYNFIDEKWTPPLRTPGISDGFIHDSGTVLNDKLYCTSQISEKHYLQAFDASSKQSIRLHSVSSLLRYATLCACNRFLYICGGEKQDNSPSNQVLRYDPQTNSFKTLALMEKKRRRAASIFYQGHLYVLGGCDGLSYLQSVEKYDPVRNEWTAVASMCEKRSGHAVAKLKGKLYACGGYNAMAAKSSVEVYDPTTDSWQLVASMNKTRYCFIVVAHEGKLLAIGGKGEKTVEVYDPNEDRWRLNDEMSSDLQVEWCIGGLFPSTCITNTH